MLNILPPNTKETLGLGTENPVFSTAVQLLAKPQSGFITLELPRDRIAISGTVLPLTERVEARENVQR